jgi:HEAT repeat protein
VNRLPPLFLLTIVLLLTPGCGKKLAPYEGKSAAELEAMVKSGEEAKQLQGAFGLSRLGAEAAPAVPALREALQSPTASVRQAAAQALGKVGPAAVEAVPELTAALHDPQWPVRRQAALTLGELGPSAKAAKPELEKLRRDPDALVRKAAGEALKQLP